MPGHWDSSQHPQKETAYNQLATAKHNWQAHFSFQDYVHCHQKAHNILADLDEPIAESKKVTDFLNAISDPTLATGKTVVNCDASELSNFKAYQQYFCMLVEVARTATSHGTHNGR